jgi:hypothetical protein
MNAEKANEETQSQRCDYKDCIFSNRTNNLMYPISILMQHLVENKLILSGKDAVRIGLEVTGLLLVAYVITPQ